MVEINFSDMIVIEKLYHQLTFRSAIAVKMHHWPLGCCHESQRVKERLRAMPLKNKKHPSTQAYENNKMKPILLSLILGGVNGMAHAFITQPAKVGNISWYLTTVREEVPTVL